MLKLSCSGAELTDIYYDKLISACSSLETGTGSGGEFTGWVHLPETYDRNEFARIQMAAEKIQKNSQVY